MERAQELQARLLMPACLKEANAPHRVGLLKYLYKTTCLSKGLQDELSSGQEEEEQKREW